MKYFVAAISLFACAVNAQVPSLGDGPMPSPTMEERLRKITKEWTQVCRQCDEPELTEYVVCAKKYLVNQEDYLISTVCKPKRKRVEPCFKD